LNSYRLAASTLGAEEIEAAKAVLDTGMLTMGQEVRAFEAEFADWVGVDHAVMVNSGSSANLLIADSLVRASVGSPRLAHGDEVIVPGLAWSRSLQTSTL
jgi:CDP-6-deoxy-D-xylo-4-hexulose-3-dehydrase